MQPVTPPIASVFISYSHDSAAHYDAVLGLSDRLRSHGVNASLDQYIENPIEGWVTWMQKEIEAADSVLVVCSETYKARLEKNEEPGIGLGAIWESQLILNDLYRLQGRNAKYIAVTLTQADEKFVPSILTSFTRYNVGSDEGYWKLYARLTGQSAAQRPPLGSRRVVPRLRVADASRTTHTTTTEVVSAATFSYAHPPAPLNEIHHSNYLRTVVKMLGSSKGVNVVAVEGPEGIGKTTFLAQFSRSMSDNCISVFLEDDDRLTYDPDAFKLNIARQAHWVLNHAELDRTSINQEQFQTYLDRLHTTARRRRTTFYLLVDGLGAIMTRQVGLARRLIDLLPPPALDGIKYVVAGEADELESLFPSATQLKAFALSEFDLDETITFFAGVANDRLLLKEIHNICSGHPAFLASVRRLIIHGAKPNSVLDSLSQRSSPFDFEWSLQSLQNDVTKKLLAHLAFNDKRATLADLANSTGVPIDTLRHNLSTISMIRSDSNGQVRFRDAWFRRQAQKELFHLRRSVHKTIAQQLLVPENHAPLRLAVVVDGRCRVRVRSRNNTRDEQIRHETADR